MADYSRLAGKLKSVRRAWKRTAALSGLAVVLLEAAGVFTFLLLFDWLYRPGPAVRAVAGGLGLLLVGIFFYRHVLRPLLARIPDEQLALYLEERDQRFEGSLMAAAEFGPDPRRAGADVSPVAMHMIDAIVAQATQRSEAANLRQAVSLSRLRKYGLGALALVVVYVAAGLYVPGVSRHAQRVLTPWKPDPYASSAINLPGGPGAGTLVVGPDGQVTVVELPPVEIKVAPDGHLRVGRGSALEIDAALSRRAGGPVVLHFRPCADDARAAWHDMLMEENQDKFLSFRKQLSDVSEDMEFYVSTSEPSPKTGQLVRYQTPPQRITVFDPIALQAIQLITKFPDYLRFPDRVENPPNGDVAAPVDSTVRVRLTFNTELQGGDIRFRDGKTAAVTVDPADRRSVVGVIDVKQDAVYGIHVADIDQQRFDRPEFGNLFALKDGPPTATLKLPNAPVETHPLGEVRFQAEASDDFVIDAVEMVYEKIAGEEAGATPSAPAANTVGRLALRLDRPQARPGQVTLPDVVEAHGTLAFEDLKPKPGDFYLYHLECTDRKGHKVYSELSTILIGYYETWGAWNQLAPEEGPPHPPAEFEELLPYLQKAYVLRLNKPNLTAPEFAAQCQALAESMHDGGKIEGRMKMFVIIPKKGTPEQKQKALHTQDTVVKGHDELLKPDLDATIRLWQLALKMLHELGLDALAREREAPMASDQGGAGAASPASAAARLEALFAAAQLKNTLNQKLDKPKEDLAQAKAIEKARQLVQELYQAQGEILDEARTAVAHGQVNKEDLTKLAPRQEQLAGKAKSVAAEIARDPAGGMKLAAAAGYVRAAALAMESAAQGMKNADALAGTSSARDARAKLELALKELAGLRQQKIEELLRQAELLAAELLERQGDNRHAAEQLAKALAGKTPDEPQKRQNGKLGSAQVLIKVDFETLRDQVAHLDKTADADARGDTAKKLHEAQRVLTRAQIDQKMTNAIVELQGERVDGAAPEQKAAEDGLTKVRQALKDASDSLARTPEEKLAKATKDAQGITGRLEKMTGEGDQKMAMAKPPADRPGRMEGTQAGGEQKGAAGGEQKGAAGAEQKGAAGGEQKGEAGAEQKGAAGGEQKGAAGAEQKGAAGGEQKGAAGGEQKGVAGGEQKGAAGGSDSDEPGSATTPGERRQQGRAVTHDLRRLGEYLESSAYAGKADVRELLTAARDLSLEVKLTSDPKEAAELTETMRRVTNMLEKELASKLEAKRLFAAQREECPPEYRPIVNQYYKALSGVQE